MIPPRFALAAVALAALVLSRRRPGLRPVALAIGALATVNFARALPLPPRVDVALFLVWPGVQTAFAWRAWVGRGSPVVVLAFALYAGFIALAPWSWVAHPDAYAVALRVPYWAGVAVSVVAWACRKENGPATEAAGPMSERSRAHAPTVISSAEEHGKGSNGARAAQAIAYVLTISAALDVTIGALAPFAEWTRAAPLAWATWGACAVVLGWKWLRTRPIRGRR